MDVGDMNSQNELTSVCEIDECELVEWNGDMVDWCESGIREDKS